MLPRASFKLETELSSDELMRALKRNTGDDSGYVGHFAEHNRRFGGKVSDKEFKISINIGYRNDFKPQLSGSFNDQKAFEVYFRLNRSARIFLTIFLSISSVGVLFTPVILGSVEEVSIAHFAPLIVFFGGLGMTQLGFWLEVPRSRKRFEDATGGRLVRSKTKKQ